VLSISDTDPRGARAVELVLANDWKTFLDYDGRVSYSVPSQRKAGRSYRATDNGCSCPDQQYRPWVACKHMLAVRVYELLQKTTLEYAF